MKKDPLSYVEKFQHQRVLVVGDVMLDEYIEGTAERISPEAPIPVLLQKKVRHVLGGAANVAANVAALGGRVTLLGHIGTGERASVVKKLCADVGIDARFVTEEHRPTTTKMRFVSGHLQLVRIDIEESKPLSKDTEKEIVAMIAGLPDHDIVIVSDYAKGVVSAPVLAALKKRFGAKKIIADMKPQNQKLYTEIRAITPNVKEAHEMTGVLAKTDADADRVTKMLSTRLKTAVVLTRGPEGISVLEPRKPCAHFKNSTSTVRDVTGAGDTLIATLALALSSGAPFIEAASLANAAAGIVVSSAGTVALSRAQLEEFLQSGIR